MITVDTFTLLRYLPLTPNLSRISARKIKVRKEEQPRVPRSLFNRPMSALRRDASKLVKLKHHALLKPFKPQPLSAVNRPLMDTTHDQPEWLIHEDWALLQVGQCPGIHVSHSFLIVNILLMASTMVYCSIISFTLELNVEDEYDVSIRQLRTLFTY